MQNKRILGIILLSLSCMLGAFQIILYKLMMYIDSLDGTNINMLDYTNYVEPTSVILLLIPVCISICLIFPNMHSTLKSTPERLRNKLSPDPYHEDMKSEKDKA